MESIRSLNRCQKGILLCMVIMILVFAVIYAMTIPRVGFAYMDTILVPSQENGNTVYSGKIRGQLAQFTVTADKTVTFQHGDKTYGPYTAKADPTAIPEDDELAEYMTGVELRQGEDILFRGGVWEVSDHLLLVNEDGTFTTVTFAVMENGIQTDGYGNVIDPMEPSASDILDLMGTPNLTHKGTWFGWFFAVFICIFNALTILFADALFRLRLAFQIQNADHAEPSDWIIMGRYIGWTGMIIVALEIFIMGLQ